jgi:hypothetical protein
MGSVPPEGADVSTTGESGEGVGALSSANAVMGNISDITRVNNIINDRKDILFWDNIFPP